eukprot:gene31244-6411_t
MCRCHLPHVSVSPPTTGRPSLPLLSTALQMLVVGAVCAAVSAMGGGAMEVPSRAAPRGARSGACGDLAFANAALAAATQGNGVGGQILKSTIPVWVCVLTVCYLRRPARGGG